MNIDLHKTDVVALIQALNEICNGPEAIGHEEFATRMGISRKEALALMAKLQQMLKG